MTITPSPCTITHPPETIVLLSLRVQKTIIAKHDPLHTASSYYSAAGGPVLGASTTTFIFLFTAGFFD